MTASLKNTNYARSIKLYLASFVSIFVHFLLFYQVSGPFSSSSFERLRGAKGGPGSATEVSFFPQFNQQAKHTKTKGPSALDLPAGKTINEKPSISEEAETQGGVPSLGIGQGGQSVQYASILHAYLDSAKVFPRSLRELGLSGVVKVRFQVTPEGKLESIRLADSQAPPLLQDEAIKFLRKLENVPVPPPHFTAQELQFELPLRYELNS